MLRQALVSSFKVRDQGWGLPAYGLVRSGVAWVKGCKE